MTVREIRQRLDKLEGGKDNLGMVIFVVGVSPGEPDAIPASASYGQQQWERKESETLQQFKGRITSDLPINGVAIVFMM